MPKNDPAQEAAPSLMSMSSLISGYGALLRIDAAAKEPKPGADAKAAAKIAEKLAAGWAKARPSEAAEASFPSISDLSAAVAELDGKIPGSNGRRGGEEMLYQRLHWLEHAQRGPASKTKPGGSEAELAAEKIKEIAGGGWNVDYSWTAKPLARRLGLGEADMLSIAGPGGLFEAAGKALESGLSDPSRADAVAAALAGQLAVAYSKGAVDGLAVPLLGAGLRKSRTKVQEAYVASAAGWTSLGARSMSALLQGEPALSSGNRHGGVDGAPYGGVEFPGLDPNPRVVQAPEFGLGAGGAAEKLRERAELERDGARGGSGSWQAARLRNAEPLEEDLASDLELLKRGARDWAMDAKGYAASRIVFKGSERDEAGAKALAERSAKWPTGAAGFKAMRAAVNLEGRLEPTRSMEGRLPCVEAARADKELWGGFVWSLAGAAAMRAAGDEGGLSSLSRFGAMPLRSSMSAMTHGEPKDKRAVDSWRMLSEQAKRSPVAFAVGLALELAYAGPSATPAEAELAKKSEEFLGSVQKRLEGLADLAYAKGLERQEAWLDKQGLAQAWRAALAVEKGLAPTSKGLAWAMANPTAAEDAKQGPAGALAISLARALGARAPKAGKAEPGAILAAVVESLAAQGLSREGLEWAASNKAGEMLKEAAEAILAARGEKQREARDRLAFVCRLVEQASIRGADPESARELWTEAVLPKNLHYAHSGGPSARSETLSAQMREASLDDAERAREMARQADAKAERLGWLTGKMLDAYCAYKAEAVEAQAKAGGGPFQCVDGLGRAMQPSHVGYSADPAARAAWQEGKFLHAADAAVQRLGADLDLFEGGAMGPVDWAGLDLEHSSWGDVVARRPAGLSKALREAESRDDAASRVAALCAPALGIEAAASGNELAGLVRDELATRWGMSPAAWRSFLKSPERLLLAACAPLADSEKGAVEARERARERDAQRAAEADAMGAMQGAWLGAMVKLNLDPTAVGSVLEIASRSARRGGESLAFDPVKDWGLAVPAQEQGTADGARFYLAEARAKADRLPYVAKAVSERIKHHLAQRLADSEWAKADPWDKMGGSFEQKAEKAAQGLLCNEWSLVSDWINKSENGLWQGLPEKITWGQMWRAQADWHKEMSAMEGGGTRAWPTAVDRLEKGDWLAVCLNSASALVEEGREMRHCVSSYAAQCAAGNSRIFSVRFLGQRVSTLELSFADGQGNQVSYKDAGEDVKVDIRQNKGLLNKAIVDKSALAMCEQARSEFESSLRAMVAKRKADEALKAKLRREEAKGKPGLAIEGMEAGGEGEAKPKARRARAA